MPSSTTDNAIPFMVDGDDLADVATIMQTLAERVDDLTPVRGTVVVTVSASASGSQAVAFPAGKFSAAPIVVTGVQAGATPYVASAASITATGFTANVRHAAGTSSSTTVTVHYVAYPA